jgi:putative membrane protein insertion efficiency factor
MMNPIAWLLMGLVRGYQLLLAPILPPACRYEPSCSRYALEALETHGAVRGTRLALGRMLRCHPWGGSGYDPVPPAVPSPASLGRACRHSHSQPR